MTNRERMSSTPSSLMVGRCAISTISSEFSWRPLYDAASRWELHRLRAGLHPARDGLLLRVELDDQLLLHLSVDDLPDRQRVYEHAQPAWKYLEPGGRRLLTGDRAGDDEWVEFTGLLRDLDDVALGDAVARNVDAVPVDQEVAVADVLARLVTTRREARAVHDVVETALED